MKRVLPSFLLVCAFAIQVSYQQIDFKPQRTTTGPFGIASGTAFELSRGSDQFNMLPKSMTVSHGAWGITSISVTYYPQAGPVTETGGIQSRAITETEIGYYGRIVRAEVCTGTAGESTIITGLKFYYENGMMNYYHGNDALTPDFGCVDATPTTPGYYLHYFSGSYGTYINQLTLSWVSNFEQEKTCQNDLNCNQEYNYCPSDLCCYGKGLDVASGQWYYNMQCP